jgi:hypothetical protein
MPPTEVSIAILEQCCQLCTLINFRSVISQFDAPCSSVYRCALPTGAAYCACLTLLVSIVSSTHFDAFALSRHFVLSCSVVLKKESPVYAL